MKNQHQLVITKVANGYTIQSSPDDQPRKTLVAKNEKEATDTLTDIAVHLFDPPPEKKA